MANVTLSVVGPSAGVGEFATIGDALAFAAANHGSDDVTITIAAGTYTENLSITQANVSLVGANAGIAANGARGAETIIDGYMVVTGNGTGIDGITLANGGNVWGSNVGIALQATGVSIANSIFDGNGQTHIAIEMAPNSTGFSVSGSSFEGWASGIWVNPGATGLSVTGNTFTNNGNGMNIDGPGITGDVSGNSFVSSVGSHIGMGLWSAGTIDAGALIGTNTFNGPNSQVSLYGTGGADVLIGTEGPNRFFGGDGNDTIHAGPGDSVYGGGGNDELILDAGMTPAQVLAMTIDGFEKVSIDNGGSGATTWIVTNGMSIQAVIDAAADGDTILVAPGSYTGTANYNPVNNTNSGSNPVGLLINKSLTIQGIDANGAAITDVANVAATFTSGVQSNWGTNIHVTAANVTIRGLNLLGVDSIGQPANQPVNKVIEVVKGGFVLEASSVGAAPGETLPAAGFGALYIGDETVTMPGHVSAIDSITISGNTIGGSLTFANGAGFGVPGFDFTVTDNDFTAGTGIGIQGQITGFGWLLAPAQAPNTVTGNTFAAGTFRLIREIESDTNEIQIDKAYIENFIANNDVGDFAYVLTATNTLKLFPLGGGTYFSAVVDDTNGDLPPLLPGETLVTQDGSFTVPMTLSGNVRIVLEGQSIQAAIDASAAGDTILVGDGTFTENVLINKSNITIVSMNGRDATTIAGIEGAGRLGAVQFAPGVTGVTLGDTDQGFTVIGFDGPTPGIEAAAVYFQGAQSGHTIRGNDIRANGDGGLVTEVVNNSNITIDGNIFSGQTFVGPNPAGSGFDDQSTLFNVPRQLVVVNSGAGSTGIVFTNNQVTGTAGGLNTGNQPQGNTLVTIDVPNSTISDNEFTGFTNRFATQLRARGNGTEITDNTFDQPDGGNSGIFTGTATGQTISGNEFNLNDAGNAFAGTGGADVIFGNGGNDSISGGAGDDGIYGGAGDDLILADAGNDTIDGGDGIDTLDMTAAGSGGSFVDLNAGLAFSSATGIDTVSRVENVRGSSGNDGLFGDDNDNTFIASGGTDVIDGRGGSDTFDASAAGTAMTVNLATGVVSGAHAATLISVENVRTGAGNDVVTGSAADNRIETGAGNDTVIASGGNDTVDGGAGMDTVTFAGNRADYTITWDGTTATVSGGGSTVTITNAGRLDFADKDVLLVDDASAEFATIGAAIAAAVDGDEILVAAGTYAGAVIDKNVAILGAKSNEIGYDPDVAGAARGNAGEALMTSGFTVWEGVTTTIAGFRFENTSAINTNVGSATQNITFMNNVVTGGGNQYIGNAGPLGTVVVTGNYISSATGNGLQINSTGAGDVSITDNVFNGTGVGAAAVNANGIADFEFSSNAVFNTNSHGIQVAGAMGNVTIDGNTFDNTVLSGATDRGAISVANPQGFTGTLTITDNTVTNSPFGVAYRGGPDADTTTTTIVLSGNDFSGATVSAIGYTGTSGNNVLTGGAEAATFLGFGGNDTFAVGGGNDTVDGGAGMDTVTFAGNRADYTITWDGTTATVSGGGSTVTITNAGRLDFADKDVLLVDDASAEFATIGAAIAAAVDGDEILVAAGTYAETLAINKGVSIFGANAGLGGSDAGRGAEAIIDGTVTIGAASAVTIDGMKFLSNDALPRAKIDTIFVTTAAGHVITNTVFESTVAGGLVNDQAIYTTVLTSGALTITNNLFTGDSSFGAGDKYGTAAWGRGIWSNVNGATLVITGNDFENARTGINLEGYNDANSTVSGNSFLNSGTGISVGIPSAGTFAGITGNSFANTDTDLNLQGLTANLTIDVGGTSNSASDVMLVLGGAGNDAIIGTDGADAISGRGGNDTITGGAGNDSINGEGGNDTVVLSGNAIDYTWTGTAASFVITDGRAGSPDGTDTVTNVEFVQFADITLSTTALFANVKLYDVDGNLLGGFATIQDAVNAATGGIGERIEVAAGGYAETVTVNKSVAIHGANAGVAHGGARGAESVLNGVFVLAADGVSIDGFSVNGGGTQGSGVRGSGSFVADDITIANTLFTGQTGQPILYGFGQGGAGATNWTVTGNKVSGITGGNATAMVFFNIDGLTVSDNLIEHDNTGLAGRRGINLDGITNGTISGNTLHFGAVVDTSWGIQIGMSDGVAGPLAITGNTVSDVASAIILLSQRSASGLDITGNTLSGTNGVVLNTGSAAPVVAGVTMSDIEVTGNTITVTGFAVRLRDLHNGAANGPVVFDGVDVSGNTIVSGTVQAGGTETFIGGGRLLNVTGTNTIEGTSGNDVVLVEGSGTVAFTGGAGDDLMAFGAGGGSFDGGAGTDTADFGNLSEAVNVDLTTGNVSSGPMAATLTGVENVVGSAFDDVIHGDANANLLQGGDGNDTLVASGGNDTMDGGNGIDTASFGGSTAAVFANLVLNTAFGTEVGNNVLVSIENLTGGAGNDALVGNAGNNRLEGGAGNDTLTGGGGDDILVAGTGIDVLFGGSGNDTAVFAGSWAGFDITESGGVFTISRDGNVATVSEVENFIFNGVEYLASQIVNSAPDDILFTDGAPSVDENADGAAITRLDATDPNPGDPVTLTVDDSRFEIVAAVGPGLPWLLKLKAGETLNFEAEASVTLNITATDSKGATRVEQLVVTVNNVNEAPEPGPGLGTWTPNAIEAGSVGAQLFPEAGYTDPDGDALTYELLSAPSLGRLLLNGVRVQVGDILSQADFEAMVYNSPTPAGLYTATFAVSDGEFIQSLTLNLNVTPGVDAVYNGTSGNDTLDGALGKDTLFGLAGDDLMNGGGGNDQMFGGDGRDTMYGGFGFDTLGGGNGNDLLFGGAGNDRLIGGGGNDTATGGDGADWFLLFNVASDIGKFARLNITDFTSGEDKIDLRVFGGLTYIGAAAFNGAGGQVRYVAAQDQLVIDWNADAVADYRIQLQTGAAFAAGDLLL